jgi:hypothetical protein
MLLALLEYMHIAMLPVSAYCTVVMTLTSTVNYDMHYSILGMILILNDTNVCFLKGKVVLMRATEACKGIRNKE